MAVTAFDSMILDNLFRTEAMRRVFSDESRLQRYLAVEAALATVQAGLGIIPLAAVAGIERHCSVRALDLARLRNQTERFGDPVPAVVEQIVEKCPGDLGEHVHWGATTQDITDTATILQIREALAPHLGRQRAHDLVYDVCRQAVSTGRPLLDLLVEDKEVAILLDRPTLAGLVDPVNYLGAAGELVDQVLAKFAKGQKP